MVVVRINTVSRTTSDEILAAGTVGDHPDEERHVDAVLADAATLLGQHDDGPSVRIVLLHHPPHRFDAGFMERWTMARLKHCDRLARMLSASRVQLVVAGHRHKLDPPIEACVHDDAQPPLTSPTVQLVAESPTQDWIAAVDDDTEYEGLEPRSFARYRLWRDDVDSFSVERTVFRYTDVGGGEFSRDYSASVFTGISLE